MSINVNHFNTAGVLTSSRPAASITYAQREAEAAVMSAHRPASLYAQKTNLSKVTITHDGVEIASYSV